MRNQKKRKKYLSILIIGLILIFILTACSDNSDIDDESLAIENEQADAKSAGNDSDLSDDEKVLETEEVVSSNPFLGETILQVDDEKVSYSETILYVKYIQAYYESIFGETIWDYNLGNKTIGDLAKQDVIDTIVERKIAKKQWNEYEVVITEEDEHNISEDSKDYLNNVTNEDLVFYGINEEVVYQFFFDNLMAERVYDATTMNVDTNISDDEAKQITIQYILISTKKTDSKGNSVSISEEDKHDAYVEAQELLIEASSVEDFQVFAKSNSDNAQVEMTFGKGEVEKIVEEAAFALKTGEISNIIDSKDGYLILYCVDDYNEDATLEKKEEIIDERQANEFKSLFQGWEKGVNVKVNDKIWDRVVFD